MIFYRCSMDIWWMLLHMCDDCGVLLSNFPHLKLLKTFRFFARNLNRTGFPNSATGHSKQHCRRVRSYYCQFRLTIVDAISPIFCRLRYGRILRVSWHTSGDSSLRFSELFLSPNHYFFHETSQSAQRLTIDRLLVQYIVCCFPLTGLNRSGMIIYLVENSWAEGSVHVMRLMCYFIGMATGGERLWYPLYHFCKFYSEYDYWRLTMPCLWMGSFHEIYVVVL